MREEGRRKEGRGRRKECKEEGRDGGREKGRTEGRKDGNIPSMC